MARAGAAGATGERTGRRPGRQDTRGAILTAARESFAARGFTGTTMRGIGLAAGVDAALIHHYFDSKRDLFLATIDLPIDPPALVAEVAAGDPATFGPRLLATITAVWDSEQRPGLVATLRTALSDPAMSRPLEEFLSLEIVDQVLGRIDPDPVEAQLRAGLVAGTVLGLIVGRYLLEIPALARPSSPELVAAVGPVVQRYLDGDFDRTSTPGHADE